MTNMYDDQVVKTSAALNETVVPDYVWDILQAWAEGSPLNFEGHAVPEVVQRYIERTISAEPKGFTVPPKIQELATQFLNDTFGSNWKYASPEQYNAGVRWIIGLAVGDIDLAEESLAEVRKFTQEKIQKRDLDPKPRADSSGS